MTNHVTIADFYLFTKLYHRICDMTDIEKGGKYVHLFRWYAILLSLLLLLLLITYQSFLLL